MSNVLDNYEGIITKERLDRTLEVLDILGAKLPEELVLRDGLINLEGDKYKREANYISFEDGDVQISFAKDNNYYYWINNVYNDGTSEEIFEINNGVIRVVFFKSPLATVTSGISVYNDYWRAPNFYSDLYNVEIDKQKRVVPIEDYFDEFASYMRSDKNSGNFKLANDKKTEELIIKLLEGPVKKHVEDLKNNDQSWRFVREEEDIESGYNSTIQIEKKKYQKVVDEANKKLAKAIKSAEEHKNSRLEKLNELQDMHYHKTLKR